MKGTVDLGERGWTRAWCGCGMPGWGPGSLWVWEARNLAKQGVDPRAGGRREGGAAGQGDRAVSGF